MILDDNFFVETILPGCIIRKLSEEEMTAYRAPFLEREARLPTLVWPRQIPTEGEPADVTAIVETYSKWLSQSRLPKPRRSREWTHLCSLFRTHQVRRHE